MKVCVQLKAISFVKLLLFSIFIFMGYFSVYGISEQFPLKYYHIFSLIITVSIIIIKGGRVSLGKMPSIVFLFMILIVLVSFVAYLFYEYNSLIINYFFGALFLVLGFNLNCWFSHKSILLYFQNITLLFYLVVFFKCIIYINELVVYMTTRWGFDSITWFVAGGPNIEASYIAMSTVFFFNRRKIIYVVLIFSLLISILYASRTAMLLTIVAYGFYYFSHYPSVLERLRFRRAFFFVIALSLVVWPMLVENMFLLKRFTEIGNEGGSVGRLNMWEGVLKSANSNYFLGYGAGNSMYAIDKAGASFGSEDNLHNLYLQFLLDFGLMGVIVYLTFNFELFLKYLNNRSNAFLLWVLLYMIGGLVQFRGTDMFFWLLTGIFYAKSEDDGFDTAF